jgi:hypothetical protein
MKKTVLFILFSFVVTISGFAQTYGITAFESQYQPLEGDSVISEGIKWGNTIWDLPIGFTFNFLGKDFDQLTLWANQIEFDYENEEYIIVTYSADVQDLGWNTSGSGPLSPISVALEGNVGSRIYKIQFANAGFFQGTPSDWVNYQVWLYETSNAIEFHFGPTQISQNFAWEDGLSGPPIAFIPSLDSDTIYVIEGDQYAPVLTTYSGPATGPISGLQGHPPSNVVYRIAPVLVSSLEPENNNIKVYPSLFSDQITVQRGRLIGEITLQLFDISGKLITSQKMNNSVDLCNLNTLSGIAPGAYILQVREENKPTALIKVVKK